MQVLTIGFATAWGKCPGIIHRVRSEARAPTVRMRQPRGARWSWCVGFRDAVAASVCQ